MLESFVRKYARQEVKSQLEKDLQKVVDKAVKLALKGINVTSVAGKAAKGKKAAPKAATSKATAKAPKAPKFKGTWEGSNSDFIRSMPKTASPKEILAAAESAGLTFSKGLIYQVRSTDAKNGPPKRKAKAVAAPKAPKAAKVAKAPKAAAKAPKAEAKSTGTTANKEAILEGIQKLLKSGKTLSIKAVLEGLSKKGLKPSASESDKYVSFLLEGNKDLFIRVGNGRYKAAKAPKAEKPVKAAAPKEGHGAMSEFVREKLREGLKAKQIVEAGAKVGLTIKEGLVYTVSSAMKKSGDAEPKRRVRKPAETVQAAAPKAEVAIATVETTPAPEPVAALAAPKAEPEVVAAASVPPPAALAASSSVDDDDDSIDIAALSAIDDDEKPVMDPFKLVS